MAPQSKTQFLTDVHALLKKHYKPKPDKGNARLTVLEAVVYGICHEGTSREHANQALSRFKDGFFDWNEVRVSTVEEIQGVLAGIPDTEARATRIRRFLRQLFEKTYGFTLEPLTKKPLKESVKALAEYEAFQSDFVEATVTRLSLGGHAIPVDSRLRRVMERLGMIEPGGDALALRALLERSVPKNRSAEFIDLIEDLADDTCVETEPDCPRCVLRKSCPTGLARKEEAALASKQAVAQAKITAKEKEKSAKDKEQEKEKAKPEQAKSKPAPALPLPPAPAPAAKEKDKEKPKEAAKPAAASKSSPKVATPPPAPPAPPASSKSSKSTKGRPGAK
jgi:endonuclease III